LPLMQTDTPTFRAHYFAFVILLAAWACFPQNKPHSRNASSTRTTTTVEISEPATVKLEDLFKQADLVAVVKIQSGDSERYSQTVYKAEIVMSFKGAAKGDIIFLGPFIGYGIGSEYLAFLKRSNQKMIPSREPPSPTVSYGELPVFYRIMYDGYSFMEIGYACVFDGKEVNQRCDYGIRINPYQVVLPKKIKTFPALPEEGDLSKKWVRKDRLLSHMETLRDNM